MAKPITMPMLSPSMTEGTLVKWLKNEGETIKTGDVIAEVETDKATLDMEAFDSGTILKFFVREGQRVPVNAILGYVGKAGEEVPEQTTPAPTSANPAQTVDTSQEPEVKPEIKAVSEAASSPAKSVTSSGRIKASPLAKKVAIENKVDITTVSGTGPGGRIVKKDVLEALSLGVPKLGGFTASNDFVAKDERIELSNMRRTIAKRLLESKTQIPHFYLEIEVNASPLAKLREDLNFRLQHSSRPAKFSLNDFIMKAASEAVRAVPLINASFEGDAIRQHGSVHLSFAVAVPDGLLTPVIRDCQSKSLRAISAEAKDLAVRAKEGKLKPEEYMGGTLCVSNLGMMGIDRFCAIINPPQAAILAIGSVVKKPVVNEKDEIVVGQRMSVTLSCDHRVADGAVAATYLQELKNLIENPTLLLV